MFNTIAKWLGFRYPDQKSSTPKEDFSEYHTLRMAEMRQGFADRKISSEIRQEAIDMFRDYMEQLSKPSSIEPIVFNMGYRIGCIIEHYPAKSRYTSESIEKERWDYFLELKESSKEIIEKLKQFNYGANKTN